MTHHPSEPEHDALINDVVETFGRVQVPAMPDVDTTVARLNSAQAVEAPEDHVSTNPQSWSIFMRKLSPLAGAAVLFAALGGFFFFSNGFDSNAAFAQAVRQFRTVQTMAFTMVTAVPGQDAVLEMRGTVKNPGWMHIEAGQGDTAFSQVFDFQSQQALMVMPGQKFAQRINMKGMPRGENPNDIVAEFGRLDPDHATYLRDEEKDGELAHVYRIDAGFVKGTTWVGAASKRPVRMEFDAVPGQKPGAGAGVTMKNFSWDVAVDDAKFSMAAPEGYEVREIDMTNAQPEDLAALLQIYAALSEAPFPADFGIETLTGGLQNLMMDPEATPEQNHTRLLERLKPIYGEHAFVGEGRTEETLVEMSATIGRSAIFMASLAETAEDWRWVGGGVRAGAGDLPLCWWKPNSGDQYQVIYNDFSIKQVDPGELPGR